MNFLNKIFIAVTATVLMSPVPALAEWVEVAGTRSETYYVDTDSIGKNNDAVAYWQRADSSTSNSNGATMHQAQIGVDCTTGEWVLLRSIEFNRNGSQVSDIKIPDNKMILRESYVPGTVGAAIHKFACQY